MKPLWLTFLFAFLGGFTGAAAFAAVAFFWLL